MPRYYLGVDGGQSSTTALIADETGKIIGAGRGGPCNHVSGPEANDKFRTVVRGCLAQACSQAGLPPSIEFVAACLGFSGGPDDKSALSRQLIRSAQFKLTHDAEIALAGATENEPGIVIIAGTGSMAFGRNKGGRTARAGGWGYIYGDEGGAFDLTRRALRAALQMEEGWGPATTLRSLLLEASGAESADRLLHRFYADNNRQRVAAFAPLVTGAAKNGDQAALDILSEAAGALALLVEGVYRNLFTLSDQALVAHIGGVFESGALRESFCRRVREKLGCEATFPRLNPAAGAVLEALRMDGNTSKLSRVPDSTK